MAKMNFLSALILTILIIGFNGDDSENKREVENKLREILGLQNRNGEKEERDTGGKYFEHS